MYTNKLFFTCEMCYQINQKYLTKAQIIFKINTKNRNFVCVRLVQTLPNLRGVFKAIAIFAKPSVLLLNQNRLPKMKFLILALCFAGAFADPLTADEAKIVKDSWHHVIIFKKIILRNFLTDFYIFVRRFTTMRLTYSPTFLSTIQNIKLASPLSSERT